ncbi:23S rRNA (adenine(2503)-C(2))-methyltransferase RlmN [Halobacteriovorax sp.]|uniref:23S rRNA (adenine(2503)-C(2))-methyltransferase RlmN n=1 Tax=Halobacteriovorax sp. TaxID=2020862 RepID=UPI003AF22796
MKKSFFQFTFLELQELLSSKGLNSSGANLLYNWYYKKKNAYSKEIQDIAKSTLSFINENLSFSLPKVAMVQEANDRTVKFLFELEDGNKVESVLIPFHKKYSICLSSQVGCAMKCSFCFTGKQGLKRNLKAYEIIGQFLAAWHWLKENRPGEERILNIVFMGQGEPLHNFDEVKKACDIFTSQYGTSIGHQKITISTSGYIPGLKRWKDEIPGVNLALSLHSAFDEIRNELIPINQRYPLEEVLKYIDNIPLRYKQFVTYEYLLIKDLNDGEGDARALGNLLQNRRALINLIPFNEFPGTQYKRPKEDNILNFKEILDTYSIPTLVRTTKGDDVLAACGQLNTK